MSAYDEVMYPGRAYPDTHPEHLATIATLFGMHPAPVERCRVLEVACGDAANLVPMAYGLPDSQFVGFDLAAKPIEMGQQVAARLGLDNLSLCQLDLRDFRADAGRFDYIIAHGLYSWIPAPLRERLLALIASHLSPTGVAFVSYNTYPGCYLRRMVWEILRFHTDHLPEAQSRIEEARVLAGLLSASRGVQDAYGATLVNDLQRLAQRDAAHVFHDDLAAVNEPVYFHQFVEHAARHDLQFLGEGEFKALGSVGLAPEVRRILESLDPLTREQYLDFFRLRRFRQTLLCHATVELERDIRPEKIAQFLLGAPAGMRVQVSPSAEADAAEHGERPPSQAAPDDEARLQAVLDVLQEASPRRLTFDDLAAQVSGRPGGRPSHNPSQCSLQQLALGAARAGALRLHVHAPSLVTEPGERPVASPVARLQLETGSIVTSLCHDSVKLDDTVGQRLLPLLDGTRSRDELVVAMGELLDSDEAASRPDALETHLRHLSKLALLVA